MTLICLFTIFCAFLFAKNRAQVITDYISTVTDRNGVNFFCLDGCVFGRSES